MPEFDGQIDLCMLYRVVVVAFEFILNEGSKVMVILGTVVRMRRGQEGTVEVTSGLPRQEGFHKRCKVSHRRWWW